jgi:hypothetical protein
MLGHEAVWGPPHVRRAAPGQPGRTDRATRSPVELVFCEGLLIGDRERRMAGDGAAARCPDCGSARRRGRAP